MPPVAAGRASRWRSTPTPRRTPTASTSRWAGWSTTGPSRGTATSTRGPATEPGTFLGPTRRVAMTSDDRLLRAVATDQGLRVDGEVQDRPRPSLPVLTAE